MSARQKLSLPKVVAYATKLLVALVILSGGNAAPVSNENLTAEQLQKYEQFKQKVSGKLKDDHMKSDFYLMRWMEAKKFSVQDAEKMLMDTLQWRKKNKIDSVLSEDFSDISSQFWVSTETYDKEGRPIGVGRVGTWHIRDGIKSGKQKRIVRWIEHFQEALVQNLFAARQSGKDVGRVRLLVDMDGFSEAQHICPTCVPVIMQLINGMESHYPLFIEEILLINAPPTLTNLLGNAKSVLSENTLNALKIMDTDKEKWMAYLDQIIDRDQRYVNFGGTKEY